MKRTIAIGLLTLFTFATGYLYGGLNHEISQSRTPPASLSDASHRIEKAAQNELLGTYGSLLVAALPELGVRLSETAQTRLEATAATPEPSPERSPRPSGRP